MHNKRRRVENGEKMMGGGEFSCVLHNTVGLVALESKDFSWLKGAGATDQIRTKGNQYPKLLYWQSRWVSGRGVVILI